MIDLQLSFASQKPCYRGILAGQRIVSSLACSYLDAIETAERSLFSVKSGDQRHRENESRDQRNGRNESDEFPEQGPNAGVEIQAELAAQAITLRAVHTLGRSYFACPNASFWVDADGRHAALTRCLVDPVPWLFGPALILALARLGVYCLHASAFRDGDDVSVFLGHSGAGKSSLARAVSSRMGAQRLCDDITPIAMRAGKLYVLPRFPQLKLKSPDENLPEALPLKRVVLLHAAQAGIASENQSLGQRALFDALTRHTVATRLYAPADSRAWWQQLPQMMAVLADARSIRPAFDAHAPERAMLAALDDLDDLCG